MREDALGFGGQAEAVPMEEDDVREHCSAAAAELSCGGRFAEFLTGLDECVQPWGGVGDRSAWGEEWIVGSNGDGQRWAHFGGQVVDSGRVGLRWRGSHPGYAVEDVSGLVVDRAGGDEFVE